MAITSGTKYSYNITAATTSAGVGTAQDRPMLYDFSDRVAELAPEESPFFVYLSKVAKVPTSSAVFRFLEDRSKIDWTSRNFYIHNATGQNAIATVSQGSTYTFAVDDNASSPSSIDWLIKGMVFAVNTVLGTAGYGQILVRVETAPVDQGSYTTFSGKIIDLSNSDVSGYNAIANNDQCQVVGTSFQEGTGAPDVWSSEIEDDFGYTQIFKTAAELSNTAIATEYRGYRNEWNRIWNLKLREHKVDIERALLFSQRKRVSSIQYTEGIVGHILKNASPNTDASALSYTSGTPYLRSLTAAEMTFDLLLGDFEVLFDPARGGSGDRLVLCGLPVITMFNKLADGKFFYESLQAGTTAVTPLQWNWSEEEGKFGHKITTIDTIHGTAHLVKEPMFRGISSKFMLFTDLTKLAYRPLVGNGLNRDTHIITNVQSRDEDLRKDMILTEAGLEIVLPEAQMLYSFEGT